MSLKRSVIFMLMTFGLGLLLGFWMCMRINSVSIVNQVNNTEAPIKIVRIKIDLMQRSALESQLEKFAEKWSYAIRVAEITPSGNDFNVQLWRSDIKIAGAYPIEDGTLVIGFYYTNPSVAVPDFFIAREIDSLREFITEIPGATFVVEK